MTFYTEKRLFARINFYKRKMNKKFKTKTELGNKELVRAKYITCNGEYLEVLNKNKEKAPYTFICEMCEEWNQS